MASYKIKRLKSDEKSILEAARTISLAFSNDPLIRWLRPQGRPWAELDPASIKWQKRRLQMAMHEAEVLRLVPADEEQSMTSKANTAVTVSERATDSIDHSTMTEASGPIAILYPAERNPWEKWKLLFSRLYFHVLEMVKPAIDPATCQEHVKEMLQQNHNCLSEMTERLKPRKPVYLEVMAVRPSMHGQGLGGKLLQAVLEHVSGSPVVLECTDKKNVGFYEKFGFEVVREVELQTKSTGNLDSVAPLVYWLMVRC